MNKKKNQTSIDLDAIMTEVLNLFTPEEQQEVIDILSNNGLEKIYQQMEEAFYHYQHPDYSSEATPIAAYLQRLWDMQTCKDYPFDEFKKDCTTVPAAELEKDLRNFILHLFIHYQGPLENAKEEDRPFKLWYIYWAMEHYRMESSLNIILEIMRQSPTFLASYCHLVQDEATIAIIYQLGQHQLPLLLSFMNEDGIAPFGKEDICSAVAQIAITNPERRLEIINWFCQLLNSYYDQFERGEDNNIAIIDYITNTLMNIRAIETLPILEKIYKRFKIPNTLTRKGIKEIKKEMPHAELKGLEVDSMEELMNLLNEFFAFNENNEFDANEFDEEYDDEFDDDFFDDDYEDDYEEKPKKSLFHKSKDYKDYDEEEDYEDDYAPPAKSRSSRSNNKVTPMRQPARRNNVSMEVCVIKPTSVDDAREITETLLSGRTVILNLEGLDLEVAQRIIDFTSGATFAISGNLQKISNYIFLVTPTNVDISGDLQDLLNTSFDASSMRSRF